jgi:hypothetical protein
MPYIRSAAIGRSLLVFIAYEKEQVLPIIYARQDAGVLSRTKRRPKATKKSPQIF